MDQSRCDQHIHWLARSEWRNLTIPSADCEILPNVCWGRAEEFGTAAFWKSQSVIARDVNAYSRHDLGASLNEELAACLLGGYGIPAELGLAAFAALKDADMLDGSADTNSILEVLKQPFVIGGRAQRYRFAQQKSRYLASALSALKTIPRDCSDLKLRDTLLTLSGIGPKTASWIVRNHRNSNDVAILDIHIVRACISIRLFPPEANPQTRYFELEEMFLDFCNRIDEPAAIVDALIWDAMRRVGPTAAKARRTSRITSVYRQADDTAGDTYDLFALTANCSQ